MRTLAAQLCTDCKVDFPWQFLIFFLSKLLHLSCMSLKSLNNLDVFLFTWSFCEVKTLCQISQCILKCRIVTFV